MCKVEPHIIQVIQKQSRSMIRVYAYRLYNNPYSQGRIKIVLLEVTQDKLVQKCVLINKSVSRQAQQKGQIPLQKSLDRFTYQILLSVIQSQ